MHTFFIENIQNKNLSAEETQHAIKVLRLQKGDLIQLIDGNGKMAKALISQIDKRNCEFQIKEIKQFDNPLSHLHLAVAPTKSSDRLEFMLEKMTEIGIGNIHLIHTTRTEKSFLNTERLTKKLVSAIKQSQKYHLPKLLEYKSLSDFFNKNNFEQKYIAHLADTDRKYLGNELKKDTSICVLIGPEGDFTKEEIAQAFEHNYQAVALGNYRLRTETAAIYATSLMNHVQVL
jgi:16S rRNA (uracil1498-N3)-methyltransferase